VFRSINLREHECKTYVIIFEIYFMNNNKKRIYKLMKPNCILYKIFFIKILILLLCLQNSFYHYLYLQNDSVTQLVEHPDFDREGLGVNK
jgi:hypothetical protein